MNAFSFLGFDLDGTLLTSSKTVSDKTLQVLNRLVQQGVGVVLVSGRHYREILDIIMKYELKGKVFVISCDGKNIYDKDGKLMHSFQGLNTKDVSSLFTISRKKELLCFTDDQDYLVIKGMIRKLLYKIRHNDALSGLTLLGQKELVGLGLDIEKIVVEGGGLNAIDEKNIMELYTLHKFQEGFRYEILSKRYNKYLAIKEMEKRGVLDTDLFLYFGDDYNDEECFLSLPHSVVMGNAPADLHRYSEFKADTNDNNGVAGVLEMLF